MPITFRHDAAAVALPSSSSTRKYGQQLVLQQQQQKYAAQQAGYDRMFDAYKQQTQNQFQMRRDANENEMAFRRENRQNAFQTERDKAMFDQRQQMMESERQRAFMEEARKMSGGMIMDDIQNGNYDPATARQLQQNLVAESEALGNPQYDATQRAEALQKIRAARALLTSNRLQKPPPPTPDEEIASLPEMNGTKYQKNKNGVWEPLQPSKQQQQQQEKQQQDIEAMRPKSAQEYYSQNEDKFQKDLDSTMKVMQSEFDLGTRKEPVTQEAAWEKMQKDHDFRQKALGKPQYGEPTVAGQADPGAVAPAIPGQERSILEGGPASTQAATPPPSLGNSMPVDWEARMDQLDAAIAAPSPNPVTSSDPDWKSNWARAEEALKRPASPTGQKDSRGNVIMDDGSKVDPRDTYATQGKGMSDSLNRMTNPDGSKKEPVDNGLILLEAAHKASQQYVSGEQELKIQQAKADSIEKEIRSIQTRRTSNPQSNARFAELKKEQERINASIKSAQQSMQQSDKIVKGYFDQQVAQQPASKKLAKAGKRPQDFAEAEFQLRNLRQQYPDIGSMPAEAKKKLKEAMAVIQAGR